MTKNFQLLLPESGSEKIDGYLIIFATIKMTVRLRSGERAPAKCEYGRVVERQTQWAQISPVMGSNPILTTKESNREETSK